VSTEEFGPRQRGAATKRRRTILRVIEAASFLFDAHGWYDVTREDIAREAGVSAPAIDNHFTTKRVLALASYFSMLKPILALAEEESDAREALIGFVTELADVTVRLPVLAIVLLPATRDVPRCGDETRSPSAEVELIDFDQLAQCLGKLMENYGTAEYYGDANLTEVAEIYLSGLLSWVLKHPDRSGEDAAQLILSQLL
jgi:AcrR family transcriptional regulator